MARPIYSAITSLDGYVGDEEGKFDWAAPDEEVHAFVNDLERSIGTYLYGRRMYEVMVAWETAHTFADRSTRRRKSSVSPASATVFTEAPFPPSRTPWSSSSAGSRFSVQVHNGRGTGQPRRRLTR